MLSGLDAYYVASGADAKDGATLEPLHEMAVTRICEMVFEALPGLVLQLMVLITAKEKKARAVVSVLLSAASAAMTGTGGSTFITTRTPLTPLAQVPRSSGTPRPTLERVPGTPTGSG